MSGARAQALPARALCPHGCEVLVHHDALGVVGLEGAKGVVPCALCLDEWQRELGGEGIVEPMRPRRGGRHARSLDELEVVSWDEAVEALALVVGEVAHGERPLVWIEGDHRPGTRRLLPEELARALPRESLTLVERREERRVVAATFAAEGLRPAARWEAANGTELVVCWGSDPLAGRGESDAAVAALCDSGARIALVDPRPSASARAADPHLPLRPGSDLALALGLASRLAALGGGRPSGPAGLAPWTLERAAAFCELESAALEGLVAALEASRRTLFFVGSGAARSVQACDALRGIALLARVVGARVAFREAAPDPFAVLARPGRELVRRVSWAEYAPELGRGTGAAPFVVLVGADPFEALPGAASLSEELARARFVLRVAGRHSPSSTRADLVLPALRAHEASDLRALDDPPRLVAVAGLGTRRRRSGDSFGFWRAVLRRASLGEGWLAEGRDEWVEAALAAAAKSGARLVGGSLRASSGSPSARERPPEHSPARELAIAGRGAGHVESTTASERPRSSGGEEERSENAGAAPSDRSGEDAESEAPLFRESGEGARTTPQLADELPLTLLLTGPALDQRPGTTPRVLLSAAALAERGLQEGAPVVVFNRRGALEARAFVLEGLRDDLALLEALGLPGRTRAGALEPAPPAGAQAESPGSVLVELRARHAEPEYRQPLS